MSGKIAIAATLALLAAAPSAAQESRGTLTTREWRCQQETARSATRFSVAATRCILECEDAARTDPLRVCAPFLPDADTRFCLDRARASAEINILRQCKAESCPECYFGGDCSSHRDFVMEAATSESAIVLNALLCDETTSPDGLNQREAKCREQTAGWSDRLLDRLRRCHDDCHRRRQEGRTTEEACDPLHLDTPRADHKLQACVLKARVRFLRSCIRCDDPPECWRTTFPPIDCPSLLDEIETTAAHQEDRHFCVDAPVCGDGFVTAPEECDPGAFPDGCGGSAFCDFDCACTALPDPCAAVTPIGPEGGVFEGELSGRSGIRGSCGGDGPEDSYSFTAARSESLLIETCGSSVDTVLHVRRGSCGAAGQPLACNDDSCGLGSRVVLPVQAGETYWIYVDGFASFSEGAYQLRVVPGGGPYGSPARAFRSDPPADLLG